MASHHSFEWQLLWNHMKPSFVVGCLNYISLNFYLARQNVLFSFDDFGFDLAPDWLPGAIFTRSVLHLGASTWAPHAGHLPRRQMHQAEISQAVVEVDPTVGFQPMICSCIFTVIWSTSFLLQAAIINNLPYGPYVCIATSSMCHTHRTPKNGRLICLTNVPGTQCRVPSRSPGCFPGLGDLRWPRRGLRRGPGPRWAAAGLRAARPVQACWALGFAQFDPPVGLSLTRWAHYRKRPFVWPHPGVWRACW